MKKQRREEQGITLVALVVTIIVLIILAGITLNIVLDNDGIINKVQEATEEYENAEKEEQEILGQVENYLNPPIPDGYVASSVPGENIVATGLVIYEGDEPVTKENHEEAMRERNQYVWIPVDDINSMVMCISNTEESVCNLVLEGDTLKCTTHPETETELCGRLYGTDNYSEEINENEEKIYKTNMDFTKRDQIYVSDSGIREPAIVVGNGTEMDASSENYHGLGTADAFLEQLKQDFTIMATSIAKNEGFYISRYEIGVNGESKKEQLVLTSASENGTNYTAGNMWYGLYDACRDIENSKQMIWGCQYDQVIKFIGEEGEKGHTTTSTNQLKTGFAEDQDILKNIYDLEGNNFEWTVQAQATKGRTFRGNNYYNTGIKEFYPSSRYFGELSNRAWYTCTTRSTLYL